MNAQLKLFDGNSSRQLALGAEGTRTKKDLADFNAAQQRVLDLLADGKWHYASDVIRASQQREGLRRLRELREKGFTIERHRFGEMSREWSYKLILTP